MLYIGARVWEVWVFRHVDVVYVCVLCASCGSSQCCILHNLQFIDAGRGCKRRSWKRHTPKPVSLLPYR